MLGPQSVWLLVLLIASFLLRLQTCTRGVMLGPDLCHFNNTILRIPILLWLERSVLPYLYSSLPLSSLGSSKIDFYQGYTLKLTDTFRYAENITMNDGSVWLLLTTFGISTIIIKKALVQHPGQWTSSFFKTGLTISFYLMKVIFI